MKKYLIGFVIIFILLNNMSYANKSFQEKYLRYKEHKIYYEIRGNSFKTLVFIHGWTGSTKSWKYQLDSFNGYKIIAIDLPGNGRSSKNEKTRYTMELFADSIITILKKEKIDKAFFIGHSMGFSVVEIISAKYEDVCAGICSIDGTHFELPEDKIEKEKWLQYNREFARSMENEKGRNDFINALFLVDTPQMLKDEIFKISRAVPLIIGKSMIEAVENDQKYWVKRKINIPCLAIYSSVFQLTLEDKNNFIKMYPMTEYHEIKNFSHFFMMEIPYKINQIIFDFLNKNY